MAVIPPPSRLLRFGLFQLDLGTGELLRSGRRVRLQEQSFRVLALLVDRPSQLITREELRQKLWPADTFVDFDDGLNAAVKKLRFALGDSADNPTFIETIPRRGYRFIASVTDVVPAPLEKDEPVAAPRMKRRNAVWWGAIGITVLTIATAAIIASRRSAPTSELSPIRSLVVLPLKNLSSDPDQQYFADGMTEELITRLAGLDGLRVISRTSAMKYKDTDKLLPQIASELKVDAVITGSVLHSGNRVRITAQLLHAASDRHLWAESYEGDEQDVLRLQNDVAHDIAKEIILKLRPPNLSVQRQVRRIDPEAHRAYLRGRYRWHTRRQDELKLAIEDFQRAIAIDPDYALAHAGLADVYVVLPFLSTIPHTEVYPKAKEAAEKALALDPTLAEAHNSNAYVTMLLDWDFAAAERGFRKAIELNPNYATAHQWYAELLSLQRRHEEARKEIGIALELDPLAAIMHHQAGQCYQQARRYEEAIQEYENAIALDPQFARRTSSGAMSWAYARTGRPERTMEILMSVSGASKERKAEYMDAFKRGGLKAFQVRNLELTPDANWTHPYYAAMLNAYVGRNDKALSWLNEAIRRRDPEVLHVNVDPEWDHLRSDPRFIAALDRIGITRASEINPPETDRLR